MQPVITESIIQLNYLY